ncbi:MAG: endonuclease/exonuclease/phosphatase family protein [Hungatella sp.]|nr:endonuclease/exonuclease/phosphatase family protein [Hungatella sp.]
MKLMTLNTHSLAEPDYEKKLEVFAGVVEQERPDIIALQEVNQTMSRHKAHIPAAWGYVPCKGNETPVRTDNHGLALSRLLVKAGCPYCWTWAPAKVGYDIYEEGLAVFSRRPVDETSQFFISRSHDFHNWKTRKMVGIRAEGMWFYSVHMGWWGDEEEPFAGHWDRALEEIKSRTQPGETVWVMGDFNSPACIAGEGWEYVKATGWKDTYELAGEKDGGITVAKVIDGWKERLIGTDGMRIDYIFCSRPVTIDKSEVICNDSNYEIVSDHYGVMITIPGGMTVSER